MLNGPGFRVRLARLGADVMALDWAVMGVRHAGEHDVSGNSVASLLKLRGSELSERAALLAAEALGDHGIAAMPDPEGQYHLYSDGLAPPLSDDEALGVSAKAVFRRETPIYGLSSSIRRVTTVTSNL